LCVCAPAYAGVYKWVDKNGDVHFADKPPPGGAEQIETTDNRIESRGLRPGERRRLEKIEREERDRQIERSMQRATEESKETSTQVNEDYNRRMCRNYRERIEDIEDELRRGYTARRGTYLNKQLRRDKERAAEYCK